jgi:hypothetical protein
VPIDFRPRSELILVDLITSSLGATHFGIKIVRSLRVSCCHQGADPIVGGDTRRVRAVIVLAVKPKRRAKPFTDGKDPNTEFENHDLAIGFEYDGTP